MLSLIYTLKLFTTLSFTEVDSVSIQISDTIYNIKDKAIVRIVNHSSHDLAGFVSLEGFDTSTIETIDGSFMRGHWFDCVHDIAYKPIKGDLSRQSETEVRANDTVILQGQYFNISALDQPERYGVNRFRFTYYVFNRMGTIDEVCSREFHIRRKLRIRK